MIFLTNHHHSGIIFQIIECSLELFFLIYSASLASLGMLLGTIGAGPLSNNIGRKWTYILGVCGSLGIGYALIAAAQNRWMLHLGRFLHGKIK